MELKDWIVVSSALIVVIGWFVNGHLSRKNELAKRRLEHRLEALKSFLPVFFSIQKHPNPFVDDPDLLTLLQESRTKFLLYGTSGEIALFEKFVAAIECQDVPGFLSGAQELVAKVRERIRLELGLEYGP